MIIWAKKSGKKSLTRRLPKSNRKIAKTENTLFLLNPFITEMNITTSFTKITPLYVKWEHLLTALENSVEIPTIGNGLDIQVIFRFSGYMQIKMVILPSIQKIMCR